MFGELEHQFSLTRAALSTCGRAKSKFLSVLGSLLCFWSAGEPAPGGFTRLEPLPTPRIVASAEAYPGGGYVVGHIMDGDPRTEYASNDKGTHTFVEFDFGAAKPIAGFRHLDRNDPVTVASSELLFMDASGRVTATVPVTHVNQPAGTTFLAFPSPITARRVRWHVTACARNAVGGAEIAFLRAGRKEALPVGTAILDFRPSSMVERDGAGVVRRLTVTIHYPYGEPALGKLRIVGGGEQTVPLKFGMQTASVVVPAVETNRTVQVELEVAGTAVGKRAVTLKPVRKLEIFLLPHSHNDIGYTALQADVEKKQNSNIEAGLRLARATAEYPPGRRALQVECRGALVCGELPARGHAGAARGFFRRGQERPDRARRLLLQHLDRALPAGGAGQLDGLRDAAFRLVRRADRVGDDQRRAGLHVEHSVRHGAGGGEVFFFRAELFDRMDAWRSGRTSRFGGRRRMAGGACSAGARRAAMTWAIGSATARRLRGSSRDMRRGWRR